MLTRLHHWYSVWYNATHTFELRSSITSVPSTASWFLFSVELLNLSSLNEITIQRNLEFGLKMIRHYYQRISHRWSAVVMLDTYVPERHSWLIKLSCLIFLQLDDSIHCLMGLYAIMNSFWILFSPHLNFIVSRGPQRPLWMHYSSS